MAIVTPTGTGNVNMSTVNGFYRVEASNFYFLGTTPLALSSDRTVAVTFANAGNLTGIFMGFVGGADKSVTVKLQQNIATVWTDVAGCTATLTAAEIGNNTTRSGGNWLKKFVFTTPAAVDTTANKWRFYVSNATGTTNWSVQTSDGTNLAYAAYCDNLVSFTNDDTVIVAGSNTVTVDGNYTCKGTLGTGVATVGTAIMLGSCSNYTSATVGNLLADTTSARTLTVNGIIAMASHGGPRIENAPIATPFIIDFISPTVGTASGVRQVNNSTSSGKGTFIVTGEVPTYQRTTLAYDATNGGTVTISIADPCVVSKATHGMRNGTPLRFTTTGALPTGLAVGTTYWSYSTGTGTFNLYDTYANAIAGGTTGRVVTSGTQSGTHTMQTVIITTDTTGWAIGDKIFVGGSALSGGVDITARTISSISGNEIILSSNVTHNKYSDGAVIRTNGYGAKIKGYNNANCILEFGGLSNFQISGIEFEEINTRGGYNANNTNSGDDTGNRSDWIIRDISYFRTTTGNSFFSSLNLPPNDTYIERLNTVNANLVRDIYTTASSGFSAAIIAGMVEVNNCWFIHNTLPAFSTGAGTAPTSTAVMIEIKNNRWENGASAVPFCNIGFVNALVSGNKFWGQSTNTFVYGAVYVWTSVNMVFEDNTYDFCSVAQVFGAVPVVNFISNNESFGVTGANSYTFNTAEQGFLDVQFNTPLGTLTEYGTGRYSLVVNSEVRFVNASGVTNADYVLKREGTLIRTGTGLTDTTAYGSNLFGLKITPQSSTSPITYSFTEYIGNQQNRNMFAYAWVKVNSANYWAGTHQMPRLTITYDNGTTVYAEAAQVTDWQQLIVPINPLTTYAAIDFEISGLTDATGTNADFYYGARNVVLPAGRNYDSGNLDYWADAKPTAGLATNLSAYDVWSVPSVQLTGIGTIGALIRNIYAKVQAVLGLTVTKT